MKKALQSMALLLVMVLSGGMFTGCLTSYIVRDLTGQGLLEHAIDAVVAANEPQKAAKEAAKEEAKYNKAAEIVIQYDETESF